MGMFSRKPKGPHVLTFQSGQGLILGITVDDFHSTEAGYNELQGRVFKDGEEHERSVPAWLVRNERQKVDVISKKTGERLGRIIGADGDELHKTMLANERQVNGPLHFAASVKVTVVWEEYDGEWDADFDAELRLSNPVKAKLEPYTV